jgi:Ni,Fe-hydrogenase III small subunit/ferredoxin
MVQLDPSLLTPELAIAAAGVCPTDAITVTGDRTEGSLTFDAGQCVMCARCVRAAPEAFRLVSEPEVAVRSPDSLRTGVGWKGGKADRSGRPADLETGEASQPAEEERRLVDELHVRAMRIFNRSLHIRHVDAGSCNGCEAELQMLATPSYDLARLGLFFTPTPRHADCLLVTGIVTQQMEAALVETYEAMPNPKLVVAAGVCALGGGCFAGSPRRTRPLDRILPVDVYVPGCPPTPLALLHGLLLATGRAEERYRAGGTGR